jgi:cysteine-rich repeat protein
MRALIRSSQALALLMLGTACDPTTLRATVTWERADIDRLALALFDGDEALLPEPALVPQSPRLLTSGETVDLLIPPSSAGRPLTILVDGWSGSAVHGSGEATALAAAEARTDVAIALGPSLCGDGEQRPVLEGCDDGNTTSGDGCSARCQVEDTPCTDDDATTVTTPNHSLADAAILPEEFAANGFLTCPGAPDFYRVSVGVGTIAVSAESNRFYPRLSLHDADGRTLTSSTNGSVTFSTTPQTIYIRVEAEGEYRHEYSLFVTFQSG